MATGLDYQKRYFSGRGRTRRIDPVATASVRRHFAATIDPLGLSPGARVLELGCGLGRFTRLLLKHGYRVTALDLSEELVRRLRSELHPAEGLEVLCCAAEEVAEQTEGPFDAAVGFFFLHHLDGFDRVLGALHRLLPPGAPVSFCEPNAFNPLVYLQVTFTPGMSWSGEQSVPRMRAGAVFPALQRNGFVECHTSVYGALPPLLANTRLGGRFERGLEHLIFLRPLLAYRSFRARRAG